MYGFYRVAEPSPDLDLGAEDGPMAGGGDGVYVFAVGGGDIFEVRLEAVLDAEAPPASAVTSCVETDQPVAITGWDGGPTEPPGDVVLGTGAWQLWVERVPLDEGEPATDRDPEEWHVLHAHPANESARGGFGKVSACGSLVSIAS